MSDFNSLFPNFLSAVKTMRDVLMPVAFVLLVVGLILPLPSAPRSVRGFLMPLAKIVVLVLVLVQLPSWGDHISVIANETVTQTLKVDPAGVYDQYNAKLNAQKGDGSSKSWWEKLFSADTAIFEALVSGVLFLFGLLASVILFYAYIAQAFILYIGYALSPIFIGFLAIRALSGIGTTYVLGLVGVMLWPLGWGCAAMLTEGLLDFMTDQTFLSANLGAAGSAGYGLQNIIGLAALGVWLIFSTIAAPVIIQKAIASGGQAGAALLGGALNAGVAGATTAAYGAASAGAGRGVAGSIAAAGAGAVTGTAATVGSSISGSTYSPTGYAMNSLAGMAWRGGGGGGGDSTSSSSSQKRKGSSGNSDGGDTPPPPAGGEGKSDNSPADESDSSEAPSAPAPRAIFDPNDLARDRAVEAIKQRYRDKKL